MCRGDDLTARSSAQSGSAPHGGIRRALWQYADVVARNGVVLLRAQRRPTVDDVAGHAGVSTSTASRALSGRGYVSPAVRERVRASVQALGYVPHLNARNLRTGSTSDVGVVVSNLRDTFYSELATAIELSLRAHGYNMILMTDGGDEATGLAVLDTLMAKRVAGVILTPVSTAVVKRLLTNDIPVVQADRIVRGQRTDAVVGDNVQGARDATAHLIAHGHRSIAMLIDESRWTTGRNRLKGFRDAHRSAGLLLDDRLIVFAPGSVAAIRAEVGRLLEAQPEVTAILAGNGLLAEGAFAELQTRRLRLPQQMSLVAYDDVPWMAMVRPGITAVAQHTDDIGRACAEKLVARLTGDGDRLPTVTSVAPSLRVRGSVRRVSA